MYENLAVLAVFAFLYSVFAGKMEHTWVNGPVVFLGFGLLFGSVGLEILQLNVTRGVLRTLAELTLALVLFNDAAGANLRILRSTIRIPERMLIIGLPLTILLGFAAALLILNDLSLYEMAILATMLAATDAALGKAVVTNPVVPAHLREGLNMESGLNDGLCVPVLFLFIALAVDAGTAGEGLAIHLVAEEIGMGLAVGITLTAAATWLIRQSVRHKWLSPVWMKITIIALAISCFAVAQSLGGSGFIAAFTGGLLFAKIMKSEKHDLLELSEGAVDLFALIIWVVFGAAVVGEAVDYISWQIVVYSILSLTLVRMVPIFLSLAGTGEPPQSKLFLGWFGPRGLASIVFTIIVLNENLPGGMKMAVVVVCTVFLSVILHGITANPLADYIGRKSSEGT